MARLFAFSFLVCAAFAWVPPWLDRPGTAALGFAFLAWSVGRGFTLRRRLASPSFPSVLRDLPPLPEDADPELRERIDAY